jgi:hypothetical protein
MPEDALLGWYSFHGAVYVSLDIAEDPDLLLSVLNHEDTHRTLCATTAHGLLQEALDLTRDLGFDDPSAQADEIRGILLAESRFVQEATATYCGIVLGDPATRAAQQDRLPEMYLAGWRLFDALLARYDLDPLEALRLARAFGCRALQTSVLAAWDARQLADPRNLRDYLAKPENSPDKRFTALIGHFVGAPKETLAAFCGGHVMVERNRVLVPASRPAIGRMTFDELPSLDAVRTQAVSIVSSLCPERFPAGGDRRFFEMIGATGVAEVSLQPATFHAIESSIDDPELAGADLVQVNRNVLNKPLRFESRRGKDTVAPHTARLYFRRPDSPSAFTVTVAANRLRDVLAQVDPQERTAVCVMGSTTSFPPVEEFETVLKEIEPKSAMLFREWTRHRPTLLYTGSTRFELLYFCSMLDDLGDHLIIHPVQAGTTWGLILIRSSARVWPMIVHPTLISEWHNVQDRILSLYSFTTNPPPATFFESQENCATIISFQRAFQGMTLPAEQWAQLSRMMSANLLTDPGQPVESEIARTAYSDSL